MPGLDTRLVPLNYLETYFVDKDTGLPLSAGIVTFYQDSARTVKKKIYKLTGTPPNYTYTELPNPCILNSAGCFVDGSNSDTIPYAFPYDGTPSSSNETLDLYYITCYSNDGHGNPAVLQWTREGQPNIGSQKVDTSTELKNYITNGQFKLHNDFPNSGLITFYSQTVALGLWQFVRDTGSTATDYVTFPRFGSIVANPTTYPRYACRVSCIVPHLGDSIKYLKYVFPDVNKFASDTQKYTLFFSGQSNSGSPLAIDIKVEKFYGTGGASPSPTETTTVKIGEVISTGYGNHSLSFVFGINDGKITGTDNNNWVSIIISFPPTSTFDASFTDFALVQGEKILSAFPVMADNEMISQSLYNNPGEAPRANGMDLYLPVLLGPYGLFYSDADIGKICFCCYSTPKVGEIECAGGTLPSDGYDTYGIPFLRLQSKLYNFTYNIPQYGTGSAFVWSRIVSGSGDNIVITANSAAAITSASDGAIPTGFTFNNVTVGTEYGFDSGIDPNGKVYIDSDSGGPSNAAPNNGTSGFTLSYITEPQLGMTDLDAVVGLEVSSIASLEGTYFKVSNTTVDYYFWFTVDGVGSDPTPGGTGVKIDLLSIYAISDVRQIIKDAVAGFYIFNLETVAGSLIPAGSYFNFYTSTGAHYYVWYKVDGSGADPDISGAKGMMVSILSTDSANDVAFGTMFVINNFAFAVPDYRGVFLRCWNHNSPNNFDPDIDSREAWWGSLAGDKVGSLQRKQNLFHQHKLYTGAAGSGGELDGSTQSMTHATTGSGGNQSNPINVYSMAVIKI